MNVEEQKVGKIVQFVCCCPKEVKFLWKDQLSGNKARINMKFKSYDCKIPCLLSQNDDEYELFYYNPERLQEIKLL